MKTLTTLAIALVTFAVTAPAIPAFAASTGNGTVPFCTSNPGGNSNLRHQLETELLVKQDYVISIDNWNGCFKATTTDYQGHSKVAYYDETLSLIRQDS